MKKLLSSLPLDIDLGILLLRLVFGGLMMTHGYSKFMGYDQIAPVFPDLIGIGSSLSFNLVISAELFCAIFVLIGLLTRFSVIPIFITMFVAYFIAHGAQPFQEKELPFAFLTLSFAVFVLGSGKYSVDQLILKK
jgi:putative oxidoreductase